MFQDLLHVRLAVSVSLLVGSTQFAVAQTGAIARVSWLAGCWNSETAEAGTAEHWMPPAGGTMFAVARTVKDGKTVQYEFMRVYEGPQGKLLFVALPSGKQEGTFTQLRLSDTEVVFENLDHDFPQRVIYRADGSARLLASIEGLRNAVLRTVEYPMKRVSCESAAPAAPK